MVYAAFKDREGNLWFGTGGGLDCFQKNKATPFSAKEGLIPGDQIALTSTGDGSVWFASFAGDTVQRLRAGRLVSSKLPAYPRSEPGRILSLYADKKNHVWLGGSFKLAKGIDGKFSYPKVTDVDEVYDVHAVVKDAEGNLWVTVWDDKAVGCCDCVTASGPIFATLFVSRSIAVGCSTGIRRTCLAGLEGSGGYKRLCPASAPGNYCNRDLGHIGRCLEKPGRGYDHDS